MSFKGKKELEPPQYPDWVLEEKNDAGTDDEGKPSAPKKANKGKKKVIKEFYNELLATESDESEDEEELENIRQV